MKWLFALLFSCFACAQTVTSAATASAGPAPGALASIYGTNLARSKKLPIAQHPFMLGRIEVEVIDSSDQAAKRGCCSRRLRR